MVFALKKNTGEEICFYGGSAGGKAKFGLANKTGSTTLKLEFLKEDGKLSADQRLEGVDAKNLSGGYMTWLALREVAVKAPR